MAPLLKIDRLAQSGGTEAAGAVILPTPEPTYIGRYSRLDLGVEFSAASAVSFVVSKVSQEFQYTPYPNPNPQLLPVESPLESEPFTYWVDGSFICFYTIGEPSNPLLIECAISLTAPLPTSEYLWDFTLPTGFNANTFLVNGLTFAETASTLGVGQFKQTGVTLSVKGSPQYSMNPGDTVTLRGDLSATVSSSLTIAQFEIDGIVHLDKLDWRGIAFNPAANAYNPQANEFFWNERTLNAIAFL